MSNRRGRARYSLVVITLCGVSALGRSLGWSTRMTQPGHALERGPRYRVGLGGGRHPLIISDGRRVVHENMPSVATEGKNPVWLPSGHHVIARNQDDDHAARIECPHENRFVHWSQVAG